MQLAKIFRVCAGTFILCFSQFCLADGETAVTALYKNMSIDGRTFTNTRQGDMQATETLVKGIYRITNRNSGSLLTYTNEHGNIIARGKNWEINGDKNGRELDEREVINLRGEVMRNIDFDKLIKIQYGNGGGRKLLMFSAVDCGFCRKFETSAATLFSAIDTTYYVIPSALNAVNDPVVANLLCEKNTTSAWLAIWTNNYPKVSQSCSINSKSARDSYDDIVNIFTFVGIPVLGVPLVIIEDGRTFTPKQNFDINYAMSMFGSQGLASIKSVYDGKSNEWLKR